jgi:hypothetical protein
MAKTNMLTEYEECVLLADYLRAMKIPFSHLAQSTFTKSWGVKIKNSKMGVNKGIPDYIIFLKNKLLFIEMKRVKGGVISQEQTDWLKRINSVDGCLGVVCKGFDEAHKIIKGFHDR